MIPSKKAGRARIGALVVIWLAVGAGAILAPGCYGRNCEGNAEVFSADIDGGHMTDDDTWESSPMLGDWLPFPRQRTWVFDVPALGGRVPDPTAYLSAIPNQRSGGAMINGSGNIAQLVDVRAGGVSVYNDSCSDYYLRLVLRAPALPPRTSLHSEREPDAADSEAETVNDAASDSTP